MSSILYYSNYCQNCKGLLQKLAQSSAKDDMHFICIDQRHQGANGATYIVLQNNQEILLPPTVTKVPALLLLNRGHQVIFGADIEQHVAPRQEMANQVATQNNGEPQAFSLLASSSGGFGVSSDNYSFLDQDAESLSAKGDGGMRQKHHYATISHADAIETPPENYSPDTIGSVSMEQLQQQRNQDIPGKR